MAGLLRRRRSAVTAVVGVTDANAPFLSDCLASLAAQERAPDSVVLAVSGTGADTAAFVAAAQSSWSASRRAPVVVAGEPDAGIAVVATPFLMVLEAGDLLAPAAVAALAGSLEQSGAELALPGGPPRAATTVESTPRAAAAVDLAAMMLRTDFWRRAGLTAMPGPVTAWLPATQAVLRASSFDVVAGPVRQAPRRGTGVAFSARPDVAPLLRPVVPLVHRLLDELSTAPRRPALEQLARRLLSCEVATYLEDAERADPEGWELLVRLVRRLLDALPAALLTAVPVEQRTRAWLAAAGRRPELEELLTRRWHEDDHPTRVSEGRVLAVLPVGDVPDAVLELSADEAPLVTQLRRARWLDDRRLELEVVAYTRRVGAEAGDSEVELALVASSGERLALAASRVPGAEVNVLAGERHHDHADGLFRVLVDADLLDRAEDPRWSVHVTWERSGVRRAGTVRDVERRGSAAALPEDRDVRLDLRSAMLVHRAPARTRPSGEGGPAVEPRPEVTSLTLERDVLVVAGRSRDGAFTLEVRGPGGSATVGVRSQGGAFDARLPLRHDPWALGETPLPSGGYRLRLLPARDGGRGDGPGRLVLGAGPAARTPYVERSESFRVRVERNPDGSAQLVLGPSLAEDEVGPRAQEELRRWYATDEHRLDRTAVYLQSYSGTAATDSPLAIHQELRRSRPDLRLVWGAADSSVALPEGAERVQLRSRSWYAALATCGHLVTNTDMEGWFRKRPGQRLLQTFHGYPSKAMGVMAWEAKNHPTSLVEAQLRRTSATWDLLLTPHPAMDVHYREQYRYAGPIHSAGYPRDDALVGPDADRVREDTRRRLGIGDRTAVLYAPTWRDDLTTNFRAAVLPSTFDVERAAAALGEDHVLLLRGHRFHRRRPDVGARLLDVTGYPEINHLLLAADAAVLDYSSLRFDFALTRRPMLFLVPDLDRYATGTRGFLYDFRSSAPGPLLETTEQVVAALRDLDGVEQRYGEAYERFHVQFNAFQDGHAAERVVRAFFG